jgi:hypothetical protein
VLSYSGPKVGAALAGSAANCRTMTTALGRRPQAAAFSRDRARLHVLDASKAYQRSACGLIPHRQVERPGIG